MTFRLSNSAREVPDSYPPVEFSYFGGTKSCAICITNHQGVAIAMKVFSYCFRLLFYACYLSFTIANDQNQPVLRRVLLATEVISVREGNGSFRTIVICDHTAISSARI